MINDNLKQILEDEGVKLIESIGKQFDPSVHHAIETTYDENYEEGVIIEEIQRGYTFKDRVLRAALVKVNKKVKEENNNNEFRNANWNHMISRGESCLWAGGIAEELSVEEKGRCQG